MATPRIDLTTSPGWEVVRAAPRRAAVRAAAQDPFVARALATKRLVLAGSGRVRPRRGAPAGPGRARRDDRGRRVGGLRRRRPPRVGRAHVPPDGLASRPRRTSSRCRFPRPRAGGRPGAVVALLPAGRRRRGPRRAAVPRARLGEAALRRRARAARPRAPRAPGRRPRRDARPKGGLPPGPGRCLLFLHGTFSHAAAAFARPRAGSRLLRRARGRVRRARLRVQPPHGGPRARRQREGARARSPRGRAWTS